MNVLQLFGLVYFLPSVCDAAFTVTDLHELTRVGAPVVSEQNIVFTLRDWNASTGQRRTYLAKQCISCGNTDVVALTSPTWGVTHSGPVFSPDGSIVFYMSNQNAQTGTQVFTVDVATGKVKQLTFLPNIGYSNLMISPTGEYLLFSAQVYLTCATLQCTKDLNDKVAARGTNSFREYNQLYVRHWDTWETEGRVSHIMLQRIKGAGGVWTTVSDPVDIMSSMVANSPVPTSGGVEQWSISPDGLTIAFTSEEVAHDTAWTTGWDVYYVHLSSSLSPTSTPVCVTEYTEARCQDPVFSRDSKAVYYTAMDKPQSESDRLHLMEFTIGTGAQRRFADDFDRSIESLTTTTAGTHLLVTAADDGSTRLFSVSISTGRVNLLLNDHTNSGIAIVPHSKPGFVYFSRSAIDAPGDIWRVRLDSDANVVPNSVEQMTAINHHALSGLELVKPQTFYYKGADNEQVMAWVIKPINFDATQKYPLAHLIHGGPESMWGDSWSTRWNPNLWASRGYAVLMINPRGSKGFGQNWTDAVQGDWGGKPYKDLMLGVDAALKSFPWMDGDKLTACGASYGGFMINWINGHTERYKALVVHDGLFDTIAMYFSSEEVFFTEAEFGGTPWDNPEGFAKFNPRDHVQNWKTPTLVVHGGKDFRIPEAEGLGAFTALQRRRIPSRLLYFEMENHWVLREENSIEWYRQVLGWLDQWTGSGV